MGTRRGGAEVWTSASPYFTRRLASRDTTGNDDGGSSGDESVCEQLNRLCVAEVVAVQMRLGPVVQNISVHDAVLLACGVAGALPLVIRRNAER